MNTTQNNGQRETQLDEEEEVATDRCIQHRTIDREIVRQRGGGGYRQIDVCNIEQQIERERQLDEEEKEATDRQMYTTQNNRQREIIRQRGGGGYRQIDVCYIKQQIEREIVR